MAFAFSLVAIAFVVGAAPAGCDPGNPGVGGPSCSGDPDADNDSGHGNEAPTGTTGTTGSTGTTGTTSSGSTGGGGEGGPEDREQTLGPPPTLPPGQQGPPLPTGPPGPPSFEAGTGGEGDESVAPGLGLSNLLWPLVAFGGVAFATILGMNRGSPVRVLFQQAIDAQAAEAWIEVFDPVEGELLMSFPVNQVIEEAAPEGAAAGSLPADPYWEGEFDVARQGRFHMLLRYVTAEARVEAIELGMFELQGDNLLFGPEIGTETALAQPPLTAPAEPIVQLEEEILAT